MKFGKKKQPLLVRKRSPAEVILETIEFFAWYEVVKRLQWIYRLYRKDGQSNWVKKK